MERLKPSMLLLQDFQDRQSRVGGHCAQRRCAMRPPQPLQAHSSAESRRKRAAFLLMGNFILADNGSGKTTFHPLIGPDGSCAGAVVALEDNPKESRPDTGLRYIEERLLPLIPLASQMVDGEGNITFSSEQIAHLPVNGYEGGEPICCFSTVTAMAKTVNVPVKRFKHRPVLSRRNQL